MKHINTCLFILLFSLLLISLPGSAQQTQQTTSAQIRSQDSSDNDGDDPDIPSFMKGKINKEEYLRLRSAHVGRLRGLPYPLGENPRMRALQQMDRQLKSLSARQIQSEPVWFSLGPEPIPNGQTEGFENPVSGRVTTIAIHPTNPETVYVGTAQGGVFRSFNGGASWTAIFDNAHSLAIGALAIDPLDNTTLFVGTGEGNLSLDCFFGVGLYIIRNAETSPILYGPYNLDAGSNNVLAYRSINRILINPSDDNIVFVATTSGVGGSSGDVYPDRPPRGLYRTTNAMSVSPMFTRLDMGAGSNTIITDAVLEPGNPNALVAAIYGQSSLGSIGGIYRTTNALSLTPTFTQTLSMTDGQNVKLAINKFGSIVTVYAATGESNGSLRKSKDGGQTWSAALTAANGFCYPQCWYDIAVAVDPTNARRVYLGGAARAAGSSEFKMSLDGGLSFTDSYMGLHADVHALGIAESPHNNIIYEGNDGGIFRSTDYGNTWSSANTTGFNATQFEGIAVHPTDPHFTIGGTQDNGTQFLKPDETWFQADWGDGGFAAIDQSATNTSVVTMYHTYYNQTNSQVGYARVTNITSAHKGGWVFLGNGLNGISLADNVLFYAPLALGPGIPNTVYFGTDRLYRSVNKGTTNTVVSQAPLSGGMEISAIGISPQNDNVRIVGLVNGQVFATTTGSSTLTDVTGTLPPQYVARAVIDPSNVNVAYVTLSGFGTPLLPVQHVWKTTNLLSGSWTSASSGLPDVPVNAFVVDPIDSNELYCGTDIGVYHSSDAGASWRPFGSGLPRVAVFDMAIVPSSHVLRIATHGRGMWEINTRCPTIVIAPSSLPGGNIGTAYDQTVTASAGTSPYTFSLTSGALPDGLTLSSAGQLSGTLTPVGHFSFTVTAIDGNGCAEVKPYNIDITCPAITVDPATLPNGVVILPYSQNFIASGGTGPYTYFVTVGSLPPGLTCSSGGTFSGTPTTGGTYNFTIAAADFYGCSANRSYTLIIDDLGYANAYRSFHPDNMAQSRDNKGRLGKFVERKADKVEFTATVGCDSTNITDLHIEFNAAIDTVGQQLTVTVPAGATIMTTDPKLKMWNIIFANPINSGDPVVLHGFAWNSKTQKINKYWWTRNGEQVGKNIKLAVLTNQPRLPMPNRFNPLYETMVRSAIAYGPNGFVIGKNRKTTVPDSSNKYGWLQTTKWSEIVKTLVVSRTGQIHTGAARGFDHLDGKTNDLVRQQNSLPPNKFDNKLLAALIALKVNITSSAMRITPLGFGELIFDDGLSNPLNGMMVREIASYGDSLMIGQYDAGTLKKVFAPPLEFNNLYNTVQRIDSAFEGSLDTTHFADSLRFTGVKKIVDVSFLKPNTSVVPIVIPGPTLDAKLYAEPTEYALYQNYPNPFNPTTTISFDLTFDAVVTLTVYNTLGQEVIRLLDHEPMSEGGQEAEFDASRLSSGVYFYRLVAENIPDEEAGVPSKRFTEVKKMLLVK